jgi:hypothetical protein
MRSIRSSRARSWLTSSRQPFQSPSTSYSRCRAPRSRLLVGSSSSRTSGRFSSWAASPSDTTCPPDSVPSDRSSATSPRPSRSSCARARSSMSQSFPTVAKCSSLASPASMAASAATTGAISSTSATVRSAVSGRVCGRWATRPSTVTDPVSGRCSPAMSRSRVLLPAPLGATSPVRPAPTLNDRSVKTGVPSGQEKDRFEQTILDMWELSRHGRARAARLGQDEVCEGTTNSRCATAPRVVPGSP